LVCSGIARAAGESFRAAEIVPTAKFRCLASVWRVTLGSFRSVVRFKDMEEIQMEIMF
jgi:hypothetical protein